MDESQPYDAVGVVFQKDRHGKWYVSRLYIRGDEAILEPCSDDRSFGHAYRIAERTLADTHHALSRGKIALNPKKL